MSKRICSVEDCEIKHYARSYCRKHYNKWMKYNNPLAGGQRYSSPDESLSRRVKKNGSCSVWTGYKNHLGYGYIWVDSKSRSVHRYVWEQAYGPIPPGKEIDHKCWNRACVNLDHLRVVSRSENNRYLSSAEKNSTSGARNVYHQNGKWFVAVRKRGARHYYGTFETIEEAAVVAEQARKDLFGEFAGRG